ncbi:portal vertex head protein [Synechococcus phage S-CRM01]|uniref:portal protein n=1 Tax=Synechococcus phage S-CRM01 TaxID=1026955 RepID=UPI000209E350|nr:portal protein [Synechococcus phage S-CRM01]AEC52985.1 portal vertex head protein [Synechococcus phage S-CRM01]
MIPNKSEKLFGFSYKKEDPKENLSKISPVPPNSDDGVTIAAGGLYGYSMDDGGQTTKDYELIRRYRDMAMHPEVDSAIEEIVNEAIVSDTNDTPVAIDLTNLDISEKIKVIMREEFSYILHLLDFNNNAHEIFRKWYIDGRLFYHKVIDLNAPERGITDLRSIDSLKIKPIREYKRDTAFTNLETAKGLSSMDAKAFGQAAKAFPAKIEEYFLYNKRGINYLGLGGYTGNAMNQGTVKIAKDSVTYITSGLVNGNNGQVLSYLDKAFKSLNQLRWMEDAIVIYRMARAPERRLFYIDVGNLPKQKAEAYLRDVMARYRTRITYNQATGEIRDEKNTMSMLEDYWLPRREGGRGTEVSTLPGGQNLGELSDLDYFKQKLYQSLNVPASRLGEDGSGGGVQIGQSDDIMRDEVNFSKFVGRMRKRFSMLFIDILKTQLVLKGVTSPKEFDSMKEHIQFDFQYDNHFAELRQLNILQQKLQAATMMEPYIGKYYSVFYIRNEILGQTDAQIKDIDRQISYERNVGIIPDPNAQMQQEEEEQEPDPNLPPEGDMDLNGEPLPPEMTQAAGPPPEGQDPLSQLLGTI